MVDPQFHTIEYPSSRQLTFDIGKLGREKHHVLALLEVDVTDSWTAVRESRRAGQKVSFTAWLLKVIADCAASHPPVAGLNQAARGRVLVFDELDLSIVVEKEVNGALVPLPYVIRRANRKTVFEIQDEIEAAKRQVIGGEGEYVLGEESNPAWLRAFTHLPQWLRLPLFRVFLSDPLRVKNTMGTIMVTTVGMLGHTRGWIVPSSIHPLCLALGSLNEQPAVHRGEIAKRSILHLTVMIDHDVVDGAPAARFVDDLARKMESGFGL